MAQEEQQILRLEEANIRLGKEEIEAYLKAPDTIDETKAKSSAVPLGYKRCGGCKQIKKFYLFNRNISSKINCSGNCKKCQSKRAKVSYEKNKHKRDYKAYYEANKERKREHSRKYYQSNREAILAKHRKYRQTPEGKKAMNRARSQRKQMMKENAGIPYTREIVIERDKMGGKYPICCLCDKLIKDINDVHMEHLVPISMGGPDCFTNVGSAHSVCNLSKTKEAIELTTEQVQAVRDRAEEYIDKHPEDFPDF